MAVYLIGFALSIGIIAFAEKKRLPIFLTCSVLALLIPCLIAGFRAQNVGTDVMVYVKPLTESAICADNLKEYFNSYWYREWRNLYVQYYEIGFSMLVFVVAKLTKNLGCVLFAISAVITVPMYIALSRNRKNAPVWLGMLTFYLLFYSASLNIMRQWAAMSFLLLALQLLREKKYIWTVILTLFACLFHSSALIAFMIYGVYWLLQVGQNRTIKLGRLQVRTPIVTMCVVFFGSVAVLLCLNIIVKIMVLTGFTRFAGYLSGEPLSLMLAQILLRLPPLVIMLLFWKSFSKKEPAAVFFLTMSLLEIVMSQLMSVAEHAIRIGMYFSAYTVLWPSLLYASIKQRSHRVFFCLLLIGYMLVYWYYCFIMHGRNEVYPYSFAGMGM